MKDLEEVQGAGGQEGVTGDSHFALSVENGDTTSRNECLLLGVENGSRRMMELNPKPTLS